MRHTKETFSWPQEELITHTMFQSQHPLIQVFIVPLVYWEIKFETIFWNVQINLVLMFFLLPRLQLYRQVLDRIGEWSQLELLKLLFIAYFSFDLHSVLCSTNIWIPTGMFNRIPYCDVETWLFVIPSLTTLVWELWEQYVTVLNNAFQASVYRLSISYNDELHTLGSQQ